MDKYKALSSKLFSIPVRLTFVLTVLAGVLVGIYIFASQTTPEDTGPLGITAMFVLIYVAVLTTLTLVKMTILRTTKVTLERLVGLALIPTIILAMRSLRQLTVVDIVLIIIFAILVNFYLKKASPNNNSN